jgi:hypothetical protein
LAWAATASATWSAPVCVTESAPGPKPVTSVPGCRPTSPSIVVRPVFVIVEPASTAKSPAVSSSTDPGAARSIEPDISNTMSATIARMGARFFAIALSGRFLNACVLTVTPPMT